MEGKTEVRERRERGEERGEWKNRAVSMNECGQGTKETVIQFTIHSTKSLPCLRLDWCTRTTTPVHQLVDPL